MVTGTLPENVSTKRKPENSLETGLIYRIVYVLGFGSDSNPDLNTLLILGEKIPIKKITFPNGNDTRRDAKKSSK